MNNLSHKGHWTVVVHADGMGGVSVPSTESDGGGGQLK